MHRRKEAIIQQNRELLKQMDWTDVSNQDQGQVIVEAFCHCYAAALVGAMTFPEGNRPSRERIDVMKDRLYWLMLDQGHRLMAALAQEEGAHN